MWDSQQQEQELRLTLLPAFGSLSPNWAALPRYNSWRCPSPTATCYA